MGFVPVVCMLKYPPCFPDYSLEPLCLLLTHLTDISVEMLNIVSTCCLIGVCYVRWLKGGVNPLGNSQFQVRLCNTKYHVGFIMVLLFE